MGTGALSDALARRAAGPGSVVDEAARAAGLHQALYVVPALSAALSLVLLAASRSFPRDRARQGAMSLNVRELSGSS